jgi:hypothetical protein
MTCYDYLNAGLILCFDIRLRTADRRLAIDVISMSWSKASQPNYSSTRFPWRDYLNSAPGIGANRTEALKASYTWLRRYS